LNAWDLILLSFLKGCLFHPMIYEGTTLNNTFSQSKKKGIEPRGPQFRVWNWWPFSVLMVTKVSISLHSFEGSIEWNYSFTPLPLNLQTMQFTCNKKVAQSNKKKKKKSCCVSFSSSFHHPFVQLVSLCTSTPL
jgi:hypothetical protein